MQPKNVIERAKDLLSTPDEWGNSPTTDEEAPIRCWHYHLIHPEFTIRFKDKTREYPKSLEWMRGELVKTTTCATEVLVYWMETPIASATEVTFDDSKKRMVNPYWEAIGPGRLYYYDRDSIEYALHRFLTNKEPCGDGATNLFAGVSIPVTSKAEVEAFHRSTGQSRLETPESDHGKQYELWIENTKAFIEWRKR